MKHETNGVTIKCSSGLKSKMYTFITEDNHESKKAKGITKNIIMKQNMKIAKIFYSIDLTHIRHEMNRTS